MKSSLQQFEPETSEKTEIKFEKEDYEELMKNTCLRLNDKLNSSHSVDTLLNGSTGIIVFIHNGNIVSANVGDSRAVLYFKGKQTVKTITSVPLLRCKPISIDQVPEIPGERDRILRVGGEIRPSYRKIQFL